MPAFFYGSRTKGMEKVEALVFAPEQLHTLAKNGRRRSN